MTLKAGWKLLTIILLIYTVIAGFLFPIPELPILYESIRNLYFHVTMWMAMMVMLITSFVASVLYLWKPKQGYDLIAVESTNSALVLGSLGIVTGMVWATYTWGEPWSGDPKQNGAAVGLLIYFAYIVLRGSFKDEQQRARISAVYNIFAFAVFIPLIYILPKLQDSLHPGDGGNPAFSSYDLDSRMRAVFYPAVIAWSLLAWWIADLRIRTRKLAELL